MKKILLSVGFAACSVVAVAQDPAAIQAVPVQAAPSYFLPANTEVLMEMNQEVTTKGKRWEEGDSFDLSVVHDVTLDGLVIIPRGSRGIGRITWLTNKGMFGKSGKMDIELEYVEVGGRRIDVSGTFRQEGEGNTVATVGGVVLAGPFAAFITGKSGRVPKGRELMAYTESDIPVAMPAGYAPKPESAVLQAVAPAASVPAPIAAPAASALAPIAAPTEEPKGRDAQPAAKESSVTCETC